MPTGEVLPNAEPAITRAHTPLSSMTGRSAASKCWNDGSISSLCLGQGDPALDAVHAAAAAAHGRRRALGVGDAAAGGHQVHGAGRDLQRVALAVAMHDAAVEQVGDGGEADVGMRAHVHALSGDELHRPHLVEEDEGTDHLPLAMRQRAAHLEAAEVACAGHDDEVEGIAGVRVAEDRVARWHPAHGLSSLLLRAWRHSGTAARRLRMGSAAACRNRDLV